VMLGRGARPEPRKVRLCAKPPQTAGRHDLLLAGTPDDTSFALRRIQTNSVCNYQHLRVRAEKTCAAPNDSLPMPFYETASIRL
jgi:hypothetical protein